METQTLTLTEFLLARIAHDEDVARRAERGPEYLAGPAYVPGFGTLVLAGRDRVLAECEAKRRIVEYRQRAALEGPDSRYAIYGLAVDDCLMALALPYADHPDYRDEWRL